jgi:hypothetical protein
MALFMFVKWWKFTTKKLLVTSLVFILNFQKNWIRFMMIPKIEVKCFQINLRLELFICLTLELLKLFLNFYSLGVTFFFQILSQFFGKFFVIYIFFQVCAFSSIFFPTKITMLRKFETKRNVGWGERGLIQLLKPKINQTRLGLFLQRKQM